MNMGIPAFNVASAVSLIIAQRLARRLCSDCKQVSDVPRETLVKQGIPESKVDEATIFKPVGCSKCNEGYKGRVGIYQVMPISDEMGRVIMAEGNSIDIADQARKEGIPDLRESALSQVRLTLCIWPCLG